MPSKRPSVSLGKGAVLQFLIAACLGLAAHAQFLTPKDVLVIFNTADPDSAKLAETYQRARGVPADQILGLNLPLKADISRAEFDTALLSPLRNHFENNGWWRRARDSQGLLLPGENKIRAIVLMRGVPLRIQPSPDQKPPADPNNAAELISSRHEASVDSELALFGIESLPTAGILKNTFYDSKVPLSQTPFKFLTLVARIDAPTYAIARRMITDAVETEKHGLWGRAYVDVANKVPEGDEWLNNIIERNHQVGIPTIADRFNDTLPKNYPMTETALYYGWYDWNVSGPFLSPGFQFRPGAVAIHVHSFSAEQLTDAHKNWAAPLLVRGAAATIGNVYEPYLHLSHHFHILHDRLMQGWSFAEAAWAAMPVTSWQTVVLGDPLYRPFLHLDGTGTSREEDREFRALRAAHRQWPDQHDERRGKLAAASESLSSGTLAEGLALDYRESKDIPNSVIWFNKAKNLYVRTEDKLRQDMHLIAIHRELNKRQEAINDLRAARAKYGPIAESEAISGWLDILDPPPPPVADPTQIPQQ